MTTEKRAFQAEVSRLLDLVTHSLYSNKQIFLRELISNASDACDKLRYLSLTQPDLLPKDNGFRITISINNRAKTLTISDNGIGMNKEDLIDHLGTIARSGTANFVRSLTGDQAKDITQIGQFGVGFYSAFMVADKVEVISRKAGEEQAWKWVSEGKGEFSIEETSCDHPGSGTDVILHMKKDETEFLEPQRIEHIIRTYSDHITIPVILLDDKEEKKLNQASALWTRPKTEISEDQYKEFYHHVSHHFDDPWLTLHARVEGKIEFSYLLFIPATRPMDLFMQDQKGGPKLYVKRVFITDDCKDLLPMYLRFVRGIVDSEDLPLNISREMLQHNPLLAKIRATLITRVLSALEKKAEDEPKSYNQFWSQFGAVLKEGLYEDSGQRETLLKLVRFKSLKHQDWISLDTYVAEMAPGQDAIYYLSGDNYDQLVKSPYCEAFRDKGIDVLILTDPIDDFWIPMISQYQEKNFKSITRGQIDLDFAKEEGKKTDAKQDKNKDDPKIQALINAFKLHLGDVIQDIRPSQRLTNSPVCLVAGDHDMDFQLEKLMRRQQGPMMPTSKRILEINPTHPLIQKLAEGLGEEGSGTFIEDAAFILLDQARLLEGETLPDPIQFAQRLNQMMTRGIC